MTDSHHRFDVLRGALDADVSDEAVAEMIERSCELELFRGQVLVERGDPYREWFVVLEGRVEVRDASGRRELVAAGTVMDIGEHEVWTVMATAIEASTVLAIAVPEAEPA